MGSPDPRQLQGEGQFMDDSVGKVAPSCGDGAGEQNTGWDCAVQCHKQWEMGVSGQAADIAVPGYGTRGQVVRSCRRVS